MIGHESSDTSLSLFGRDPEEHDFALPKVPAPRGRAIRYISWGEPRPKRMPLLSLTQSLQSIHFSFIPQTVSNDGPSVFTLICPYPQNSSFPKTDDALP